MHNILKSRLKVNNPLVKLQGRGLQGTKTRSSSKHYCFFYCYEYDFYKDNTMGVMQKEAAGEYL